MLKDLGENDVLENLFKVLLISSFKDVFPQLPVIAIIFPNEFFGYTKVTIDQPLVDDDGTVVTDKKGNPKPDSKLTSDANQISREISKV